MSTSGTHGFSSGDTYNILPPFDVDPSLLDIVPNTQEFVPIPGRAMYHKDLLLIEGNGEVHLSQEEYDEIASLFTDTPIAPTAPVDTNTTQIATTAFVIGQASDDSPLMNNTVNAGTSKRYSRKDHIHPVDTSRAPVNNPTLTGTVTVPDTSFTYAKLQNVSAADKILGRVSVGAGVIEEITCTAAGRALLDDATATNQRITIGLGNVTNESKATMFASPALTGDPTAPTASSGDSSTTIANTEFVNIVLNTAKATFGLYQDAPNVNMCVVRNPQMDNTLPTNGREIFPVLTIGAFTTSMIGRKFKCTNAGTGTGNFRQGTTALLRSIATSSPYTVTDIAANTPLVLNTYYWVIAAGTPDSWGGTELTPVDTIQDGVWYIVKNNSITYNSNPIAASTYDPYYNADPADGANISPSLFKGVSSALYFTGTGNVYEFNGIVVESSTGNGTTSGTLTLNWIPPIYDILNPTTGKEWALKAIKPRDKTLKITGGNYTTKTLNFVVSGLGGYPTFYSTDFPTGMPVSFYNPFNSTITTDFSQKLLPSSKPSYANKYVTANTLFKRKTDGYFCGLAAGVSLTDSRLRIGYYITDDFTTSVTLSSKPIIDGKLTDIYISSGTLTSGSKYKVISTELSHFGSGVVVGDYFVSNGTQTCDSNNIVRKVDDTWFYTATMGNVEYVGETSDGKHIWEAPIGFVTYNGTPQMQHSFIRFDETFDDKYMKVIDIELYKFHNDAYEANVYDLYYSNHIFYNGQHRISIYGVTGNLYTQPRPTYEYISTNGKYGPYTTRNVIHVRDITNDAYPCSRDIELFKYFIYNSKLYAFASGTSMSSYCGFDANKREVSLYRYDDANATWKLDPRSPILINPIFATSTLWGSAYEWAQTHLGGGFAFCIDGDIMRINLSAEESSNTYDICYGEMNLKTLSAI